MNNVTHIAEPVAMKRVFDVDGEGNSQAPEQLHPAQIPYAEFGDNPALKQASEALKYAFDGLAQIDELRANPHPEYTPARHARTVREALDGFDHAHSHKFDSGRAALKAEHRRVESELATAANLKPNDKHFAAIVGTFQGFNPGQRAQTLDQLIEQQDGPSLASLLEAPLFLTGLTAEQRDSIKLRMFLKVNPQGVALRDALAKSLERFEAASYAAIKARASLLEGTDRFDKRRAEAEALANKARAGFAA
jgi:hypothetical protein